ncbi:unnamed protein product, partial [Candidula unifasciata]
IDSKHLCPQPIHKETVNLSVLPLPPPFSPLSPYPSQVEPAHTHVAPHARFFSGRAVLEPRILP